MRNITKKELGKELGFRSTDEWYEERALNEELETCENNGVFVESKDGKETIECKADNGFRFYVINRFDDRFNLIDTTYYVD